MPLLVCPNDSSAMQEIDRNGVLIDVCPECRGVWMDRGELEKLLQLVEGRASREDHRSDSRSLIREPGPDPRYDDRDRGEYRRDDYDRKKRKRRFDIFDFFD